MEQLEIVLKILTLAVVVVAALRAIHLPPLLGYLLAGTLVGPAVLGWLDSGAQLDFIAEFGVVFLLFTIGLEVSLPKLISMRRALLGLGGLQMLFCTVLALGICLSIGLTLPAAITVAGALALSSTAVAIKLLVEQGELHHSHGRLSLSILLFQDLAAVLFLILIPALGSGDSNGIGTVLFASLVKGILVFVLMLLAGRWVLRPLFQHIANARSSELFMLTALLVVLTSAFITEHLGLSMALGAFLAGVMLAETEYHHQIENDIEPFRDILLGLFFIKVGLMLQPATLIQEWFWVLCIVIALIIGKTIIITALARMAGYNLSSAIRAGLILAQGGELGFAFLTLASEHNLMLDRHNQIVIAVIVFSVLISPFMIRNNERLSKLLTSWFDKSEPEPFTGPALASDELKNHVIICGYGRVGQALARFLEREGIPFLGLDLDPKRLKEASAANEPIIYGDSIHLDTLEAVGIERAKLIILSYDDPIKAKKTLSLIRGANLQLPVLVRTRDDSYLEALQQAGATEVVPETLEASLMLASHMLLLLGFSPAKVQQQIEEVKHSRYQMLRAFFQGVDDNLHVEQSDTEREALHAVRITEGAFAIDHSIEEMFEAGLSIKITSFARDGFKTSRPSPDTLFRNGDILVLQGTKEELYLAEEKLLQG
jgi:CPA2 family monovalent cation:H+ antiporter-2